MSRAPKMAAVRAAHSIGAPQGAGKLPAEPIAAAAPSSAGPSAAELQARIRFELQPLVSALALLTNCVRVVRAVTNAADVSPQFRAELRRWCPDYADPLVSDGATCVDATVMGLANVARKVGRDLCDLDTEGGAA